MDRNKFGILRFMQIGDMKVPDTEAVRAYELALVVKPDLDDDGREKLLDGVRKLITNWGGKVEKTSEEGKKQLAYEIDGYNDAWYYFLNFTLASSKLHDLDARVRYNEDVVRYLLVREDDK